MMTAGLGLGSLSASRHAAGSSIDLLMGEDVDKTVTETKRIAVLCIGNILMLDEGVGPRVAQELLAHFTFPANVDILDCGTMGMSLLSEMKRYDIILVVDAVDNTGQAPGTVLTFSPEDIAPFQQPRSAHDTLFIDVLQAAKLLGYTPEGFCLGVQILNMYPEQLIIGLTPAVEAALPLLVYSVLKFLVEHGAEVLVRETGELWDGITVEI